MRADARLRCRDPTFLVSLRIAHFPHRTCGSASGQSRHVQPKTWGRRAWTLSGSAPHEPEIRACLRQHGAGEVGLGRRHELPALCGIGLHPSDDPNRCRTGTQL